MDAAVMVICDGQLALEAKKHENNNLFSLGTNNKFGQTAEK